MIRRRARNRKEVIDSTSVKDFGSIGHLIMIFNFVEMSNMNIFQ